jgi:hypothetical protein
VVPAEARAVQQDHRKIQSIEGAGQKRLYATLRPSVDTQNRPLMYT